MCGQRRFAALGFAAMLLAGCAATRVENDGIHSSELRRMLARTAAVRGLPLPDRLDTRVVQRSAVEALLRQMLLDEWSTAELQAAQETMTTTGLWPPGLDLVEESIRVQGGEIAGLYSPPRRTLYLVEGVELPDYVAAASAADSRERYTEFVLAHEIVHALQHQAFPQLFALTSAWKDQDDIIFALHAAIEGDALRYGLEAITPERQLPPADLFAQTQTAAVRSDAPALLRHALLFPYVSGYPLALLEAKHLLASPPVSTEQALHADKRREPFWSIRLRAVALPPACVAVGENTMGEFLISVLLRDLGTEIDEGAWQGWNGDRYLVARCKSGLEFIWLTSWDSESDAREFQAAYDAIAVAVGERAALAAPPRTRRAGTEVVVFTTGLAPLAVGVEREAERRRVANLADIIATLGRH